MDENLQAIAADIFKEVAENSSLVFEESIKILPQELRGSRLSVLGVLGWTFSELKKHPALNDQNSFDVVLLLLYFLQNSENVLEQILSGKYVLACAGLKQEMEMVARGNDILKTGGKDGKVPNIKNYPGDMGAVYGKMNEVAHVSKGEVLGEFVSKEIKEDKVHVSYKPNLINKMLFSSYSLHFYNCISMASMALNFLGLKSLSTVENLREKRNELLLAFDVLEKFMKNQPEN